MPSVEVVEGQMGNRHMKAALQKHLSMKHMVCNFLPVPLGEADTCSSTNVAGCTYCGVGVLKLLGRIPAPGTADTMPSSKTTATETMMQGLLRWLVSRQTLYVQDDDELTMDEEDPPESAPIASPSSLQVDVTHPMSTVNAATGADISLEVPAQPLYPAGFNGRCNKVADTCYAFWVGGSLGMLGKTPLQDFNAIRRYLLDKTQHVIGGFGKICGDPPDILHSYLGLAALATMREPELRSIDPTLSVSMRAREDFLHQFSATGTEDVKS
ncbi:MAG: hypothetical protein Q9163_005343 [Psora crenata]